METALKRKAHFTEIGPNGKLGREVPDEYEKAAETACLRNAPVKITLTITVCPPESENIGKVSYDLKTTLPTRKSIAFDAAFDRNVVIATNRPLEPIVAQEALTLLPEFSTISVDGKNVPNPFLKEVANG